MNCTEFSIENETIVILEAKDFFVVFDKTKNVWLYKFPITEHINTIYLPINCIGCENNEANQLSHMDYGGCLYVPDIYVRAKLTKRHTDIAYNYPCLETLQNYLDDDIGSVMSSYLFFDK